MDEKEKYEFHPISRDEVRITKRAKPFEFPIEHPLMGAEELRPYLDHLLKTFTFAYEVEILKSSTEEYASNVTSTAYNGDEEISSFDELLALLKTHNQPTCYEYELSDCRIEWNASQFLTFVLPEERRLVKGIVES